MKKTSLRDIRFVVALTEDICCAYVKGFVKKRMRGINQRRPTSFYVFFFFFVLGPVYRFLIILRRSSMSFKIYFYFILCQDEYHFFYALIPITHDYEGIYTK